MFNKLRDWMDRREEKQFSEFAIDLLEESCIKERRILVNAMMRNDMIMSVRQRKILKELNDLKSEYETRLRNIGA